MVEYIGILSSDPPGAPNITGLVHGQVLKESDLLTLTCVSMAGNPLADLEWFKGDEKIAGIAYLYGLFLRTMEEFVLRNC